MKLSIAKLYTFKFLFCVCFIMYIYMCIYKTSLDSRVRNQENLKTFALSNCIFAMRRKGKGYHPSKGLFLFRDTKGEATSSSPF